MQTEQGRFFIVSLIDITERVDGEFRFLVDQAPDGIIAARGESLLFGNRAFVSLLGYGGLAEIRSRWPADVIHVDDRERLMGALNSAMRDGKVPDPQEVRLRHRDGRTLHVEARVSHVIFAGAPAARVTLRDMTELRRIERTRDLLAAIVEYSEDAIIGQSPDGLISTWNRGAEQLFGRAAEDAIGTPINGLFTPESLEAVDRARAAVSRDEMFSSFEAVAVHAYGHPIDLSVRFSAVRDEQGRLISFSVIARDIEAAKTVERRLLASLQEKEVLLREIHHRVKNNLQVVASLLNLQSRRAAPELAHVFDEMQERVHSIALFHDQLCHSENLARVGVADYLRELAARLLHQHDVPPELVTAEVEVENILIGVDTAVPFGLIANELISNALKHAFPGARRGSIRIEMAAIDSRLVRFRVTDDGVGLPPDFAPTKSSTLGMILVQRLARQLEGNVEIGAAPQGGTRVTLTFPVPDGSRRSA